MALPFSFARGRVDTRSSPLVLWPLSANLTIASLLYLALPLFLFAAGWLRFPFNLFFPAVIASALWVATRFLNAQPRSQWADDGQKRAFRRCFWWTYLPMAFCTFHAGAGGFGDQVYDWDNKHNIVVADLMRFNWPVRYPDLGDSFGHGPYNLVYYLGYYLPAACVGKIAGWVAANVALQLWTQAAMLLLALWLVTLFGPRSRWLGVLFCIFAGADQWGQIIGDSFNHLAHGTPIDWRLNPNNLWWAHFWTYQRPFVKYYVLHGSNFQHLFWAPQHLLSACLGCVLLLRSRAAAVTSNDPETPPSDSPPSDSAMRLAIDVFVLALLPFWSPFAAMGCAPLVLFNAARAWKNRRLSTANASDTSRRGALFVGAGALLLIGLVGCYLSARLRLPELSTGVSRGVHLEFLPLRIWHDVGWLTIPAYLLWDALEFGLLLLLAWPFLRGRTAAWRGYALTCAILLGLLPFFLFGFYNDLVMRTSIPSLLVVIFVVLEALQSFPVRQWKWRQWAIVFLLVGGLGHASFYGRNILRNTRYQAEMVLKGRWSRVLDINRIDTMPNLYQEYRKDVRPQLVAQYIGDDTTLFARFLLKKPAPLPNEKEH